MEMDHCTPLHHMVFQNSDVPATVVGNNQCTGSGLWSEYTHELHVILVNILCCLFSVFFFFLFLFSLFRYEEGIIIKKT